MWAIQRAFFPRTFFDKVRNFSNYKYFDLSVSNNNISTVYIKNPPINVLDVEVCNEFLDVLNEVETKNYKGMVITSGINNIFSAGLNLFELIEPNKERFRMYFLSVQNLWMKLYGSPLLTVAAVNGHAAAGGCFIALCCDYRVMVDNFAIGLNEAEFGVMVPSWLSQTMINIIGFRNAELAVINGTRFKTDEALSIGLIDEKAVDKNDALMKAEAFFKRFDKIQPKTISIAKQRLRGDYIEKVRQNPDHDWQFLYPILSQPESQQNLKSYVEFLKNKKK